MKKVAAAFIVENGFVLTAQRNSKDKLANKWEFPGGGIELGETPHDCLIREMKEELQINVKVGQFYTDSIYRYESGEINLLFYWVEILNGDITPIVHDEIKWVTIEELGDFDFAPADIPIVERLREGRNMSYQHGLKPSNVLTNKELMNTFRSGISGGMRPSNYANALILISDYTKSLYDDRCIGNIFSYTGMGQEDPQSLDYRQNKTLYQSNNTNISVYLKKLV